jgi:hypothetical protein
MELVVYFHCLLHYHVIPKNKIVSFSLIISVLTKKTFNLRNTNNPFFCYKKWKLQIGMCVATSVIIKETFDLGILWKFCMMGCSNFALGIVYIIVHPLLGTDEIIG